MGEFVLFLVISIALLFAHWAGDYAFQTNQMANQKAFSLRWLSLHVLVYSIPLTAVAFIVFEPGVAWKFVVINAGLHWVTDWITGRIAYRYREVPRLYYPIVGFDQFIHAACLLGTPMLL